MKLGKYSIDSNQNGKVAIFDTGTGQQISQWWNWIEDDGLIKGESEYYIAKNETGNEAIFHKDNPGKRISQWWDGIYKYGLVDGKSEHYIVRNEKRYKAIFHKDKPNTPLTRWGHTNFIDGIIAGRSKYYIIPKTYSILTTITK